MTSTSCGSATGWSAGHSPFAAYAMCALWFGLSRPLPAQHSGKITWRRRLFAPQFGTVDDGFVPASEQFQNVTFVLCGSREFELPPIITKSGGNGFTGARVDRR